MLTPFQFAISQSLDSEVGSHCGRFVNNLTIAPCPCADHAVFFKHAHVWDKNGGDLLSYTLHRHQCRCSENLYTFHGGTSQLATQLFQPLWSERDELWRRVRFVRASHVAAIICISTCFCKVVVLSSFVDTLLFCSRMKDRNFDMPYVMLRGKTFFVTYGWSLNNVCHVSAVPFYLRCGFNNQLCSRCATASSARGAFALRLHADLSQTRQFF